MLAGVLTVAVGFIVASRADSYYLLLAANLMIAIGVTAATLLPASLVVASWFGERRGLAAAALAIHACIPLEQEIARLRPVIAGSTTIPIPTSLQS